MSRIKRARSGTIISSGIDHDPAEVIAASRGRRFRSVRPGLRSAVEGRVYGPRGKQGLTARAAASTGVRAVRDHGGRIRGYAKSRSPTREGTAHPASGRYRAIFGSPDPAAAMRELTEALGVMARNLTRIINRDRAINVSTHEPTPAATAICRVIERSG
jgi:hypothetical protein